MAAIRLLFLSCLVLVFTSCKPNPTPGEGPIEARVFELVTLNYEGENLKASYEGDIDGVPVTLNRISPTTLGLVVPEIAPGDHTLDFELDSLEIKVLASATVNTAQVLQNHENELLDLIESVETMDKTGLSQADLNKLNEAIDLANEYLARVATMSEQDKSSLALALSVNKLAGNSSVSSTMNSADEIGVATSALTLDSVCSDPVPTHNPIFLSNSSILQKLNFGGQMLLTLIGSAVIGSMAVDLFIEVVGANVKKGVRIIAAGVAAALALEWVKKRVKLRSDQTKKFICDFANDPFGGIVGPSSLRMKSLTAAAVSSEVVFKHDEPKSVVPRIELRAINESDLSKGDGFRLYLERLFEFNEVVPSLPVILGLTTLPLSEEKEEVAATEGRFSFSATGNSDVELTSNGTLVTARSKSYENESFTLKTSYTVGSYSVNKSVAARVVYENMPPVAAFTHSVNGLKVTLNSSGSTDEDGRIVKYVWNVGDGSGNREGQNLTYTYTNPGSYTVTLTVTDDKGETSSVSKIIKLMDLTCAQMYYSLGGDWVVEWESLNGWTEQWVYFIRAEGTPVSPFQFTLDDISVTYTCEDDSLKIDLPTGSTVTIEDYSTKNRQKNIIVDQGHYKLWIYQFWYSN